MDGRLAALVGAAMFGASTPASKRFVGTVDPIVLAGLFYAGSAIVLSVARVALGLRGMQPPREEVARLVAAIVCGGLVAPSALFWGLREVSATAASLLLATETAFTAIFARTLFGERLGRRAILGIAVVTAGAALAGWEGEVSGQALGVVAILFASAAWGLDTNLTRDVRGIDPTAIVTWKGLVGGTANLSLAFALGRALPPYEIAAAALATGALGYGVSLALFVVGLRRIGAARAGAAFATGPLFGAALGILWLGEPATLRLGLAAATVVTGLVLLFRGGADGARTP